MAVETEAKFYLLHPEALEERLRRLGPKLVDARLRELNLRFDTGDGALRRAGRVLRLRQDKRARLTFKDSDSMPPGSLSRRELEVTVSDFGETRELLEALDYQVAFTYEKFRSTYQLGRLEIVLDELPYGHFIEIEGDEAEIRPVAESLGLAWQAVIRESYHLLFERARAGRGWDFTDLTFENFKGIRVSPEDLGVQAADG